MGMNTGYCGFFILTLVCIYVVENVQLPTFNWDPRNPIFNSKDCNDGYAHISVDSGSSINFLCPSVIISNTVLPSKLNRNELYENMYLVTKDEFDTCQINKNKRKLVLRCDSPINPDQIKYKSFYIHTITSDGYSFRVNKTYYLIATSDGTEKGLENLNGGRCKSNNMRLAMTICDVGKNCYSKPMCKNPQIVDKTAPPPKETTARPPVQKETVAPVTETVSPVIGSPNKRGPEALPSTNKQQQSSNGSEFSLVAVICLIAGLIGGLLIGVALILLLQKIKKSPDDSLKGSDAVFTVEIDPNETLRREANRKYFSGDNPTYRHSTEFKRLLSTNSATSGERHSVVPLGEYTSPAP